MSRPVYRIAFTAVLALAAVPDASACSTDAYMGTVCAVPYMRGQCPQGWMPADGQVLAISDNLDLFSLIGTTYGGDGRTTFALPDLRGRVVAGVGEPLLGETFGSESLQIGVENLPPHTHDAKSQSTVEATLRAQSAEGNKAGPTSNVPAKLKTTDGTLAYAKQPANVDMHPSSIVVNANVTTTTEVAGGAVPLANFQPTLVLFQCINTTGPIPPRP